jgi:hypothetical protein
MSGPALTESPVRHLPGSLESMATTGAFNNAPNATTERRRLAEQLRTPNGHCSVARRSEAGCSAISILLL